jgi:hypothetical protein
MRREKAVLQQALLPFFESIKSLLHAKPNCLIYTADCRESDVFSALAAGFLRDLHRWHSKVDLDVK